MVYAIILAAGNGTRMGENYSKPKQYLKLNNFLVIEHTLKKFLKSKLIDKIIIVHQNNYGKIINRLIKKYQEINMKIFSCNGGNNRNLSIYYALNFIKNEFNPKNDDIIVTHDGVRIFIDPKIIDQNIILTKKYGASETVIYATDTINFSKNGFINQVLTRNNLRIGQTPQCFKWSIGQKVYKKNTEDFNHYTDAIGLLLKHNYQVAEVISSNHNMKITSQIDFFLAKLYLKYLNKKVNSKK